MEKNYEETSGAATCKLTIRALMETVEAGSKNMEVAVMSLDEGLHMLPDAEVDRLVEEIDAEKTAAEAARRGQQPE